MKKILFAPLLILLFCITIYGDITSDEVFNEIYSVASKTATDFQLTYLEKKYGGKEVSGTGFVKNVYTSPFSFDRNMIAVLLRIKLFGPIEIEVMIPDTDAEKASSLEKGELVSFSGKFSGFLGESPNIKIMVRGGQINKVTKKEK